VVEALAEKFGAPELQTALKEGRWCAYLLGKASNTLARMLGGWIADGWSDAYLLHGDSTGRSWRSRCSYCIPV
jgi:nitrate/nitrite transporter NarK